MLEIRRVIGAILASVLGGAGVFISATAIPEPHTAPFGMGVGAFLLLAAFYIHVLMVRN